MYITQFICEDCIITDLNEDPKDKNEVLQILAKSASRIIPRADPGLIYDTLKEREQLGSTGIGNGIAIPHCKLQDLERLVVIFIRSKKGVPFEAVDQRPVHIIFLILAPETTFTLYLRILSRIARILKTPNVLKELLNADRTRSIRSIIERADSIIPLSF